MSVPLAEVLAILHYRKLGEALERAGYGNGGKWEDTPLAIRSAHLVAMADMLEQLKLLGLHVRLEGDTPIVEKIKPPAPMPPPQAPINAPRPEASDTAGAVFKNEKAARSAGYTGATCHWCGSMRMKGNGHCQVCEECGQSSECS
jgi:hypothetical protein